MVAGKNEVSRKRKGTSFQGRELPDAYRTMETRGEVTPRAESLIGFEKIQIPRIIRTNEKKKGPDEQPNLRGFFSERKVHGSSSCPSSRT